MTDPTIDSQVVSLQATGAEVLLTAATPKFAAQAIRRVHEIGWKPLHYLTNVSISVGAVMEPAGPERGIGIITSAYLQGPDRSDLGERCRHERVARLHGEIHPGWRPEGWRLCLRLWRGQDDDAGPASSAATISRGTTSCARRPTSRRWKCRSCCPGITVNTAPDNFHPIRQMQLQKWNGKTWERFGGMIEGAKV